MCPSFSISLNLPQATEVHLWQLFLPEAKVHQQHWSTWLSEDEQARAERLLKPADRDRFVLSRGGLRYLLAAYLGDRPESLRFAYGKYGKPSLEKCSVPLSFNLAHSGQWVVYGFTAGSITGVDVETVRSLSNLEALARRCLAAEERASLPTDESARLNQFLQYWTVKEAHLKAVGLGLSYPMKKVQVNLASPSLVRAAVTDGEGHKQWSVELWKPDAETIAAVCVNQASCQIQRRSLLAPDLTDGSPHPPSPRSLRSD